MKMNCNATQAAALPNAASASSTREFGAAWIAAFARIQTRWQQHVARTTRARSQSVFADIDAHTLKDIGAPNWAIADAVHRSDSRGMRLIDLYRS
jgi:hypothetical protein